jgi:hypothetical protein
MLKIGGGGDAAAWPCARCPRIVPNRMYLLLDYASELPLCRACLLEHGAGDGVDGTQALALDDLLAAYGELRDELQATGTMKSIELLMRCHVAVVALGAGWSR